MYQLYYYPLNASMAPRFILEELAVDFELILVDKNNKAQKSPEYLALNPTGRIPTLVDDGFAIFESPAICIHLAESHPSANLIPLVGDKNRALCFQWMMYLTNTLQSTLMAYYYPERHTTDMTSVASVVEAQEENLTDIFVLLDCELEGKDFLVGDKMSVCDYFLFMIAIWADELKTPPLSFKHLSKYLCQLAKRDVIRKVCEKEGLSLENYR